MRREEDEQLWDLLGRGGEPDISPFFARNVVRTVREKPAFLARLRPWIAPRRLVPASVLAVVLIGAFLFMHQPAVRETPVTEVDLFAKIDAQDYEVVADLDELLTSDENSLWDDSSSL